jgi:hypothetical protein
MKKTLKKTLFAGLFLFLFQGQAWANGIHCDDDGACFGGGPRTGVALQSVNGNPGETFQIPVGTWVTLIAVDRPETDKIIEWKGDSLSGLGEGRYRLLYHTESGELVELQLKIDPDRTVGNLASLDQPNTNADQ